MAQQLLCHKQRKGYIKPTRGERKMKKLCTVVVFVACSLVYVPFASAISWTLSPDANSLAFGHSVMVGLNQINFLQGQSQPQGIFGAGFTMHGKVGGAVFDADLYSWDSYNAGTGTGTGYYDAFIVMVSTAGYYWNLGLTDPIAPNASTFVWGGKKWGDGILDSYITAPAHTDLVKLTSLSDTTFYVSLVLDTKTNPYSDTNYPSWGSFHVNPVPEPGTIVLFGIGMLGMAIFGKRRMSR
jgi:hypothetical protein